jgi:hypothetical protein
MKMDSSGEAKPSSTIVFPVSDLERAITDAIPLMPPPSRWPAFNALRHLNRAWKLMLLDQEMMMFRCITAEEEAATALFKSLQRRKYDGATQLKSRRHVHKNAVIPFINAVGRVFASLPGEHPETVLFFNKTLSPPRFELRINTGVASEGKPIWAKSNPLHFTLSKSTADGANLPIGFSARMAELASEVSATSVHHYLEDRAKLRNKLLYASSNGYFQSGGDLNEIFNHYRRNVFTLLKIYFMVDPYERKQNFAQQCLTSFLSILKAGPDERTFE